jgi:Zn-dependent protease with chaperone function
MFGRLHRSLAWACKIIDVPEPEMYVMVDPVPNAFTYGHTKRVTCSMERWRATSAR